MLLYVIFNIRVVRKLKIVICYRCYFGFILLRILLLYFTDKKNYNIYILRKPIGAIEKKILKSRKKYSVCQEKYIGTVKKKIFVTVEKNIFVTVEKKIFGLSRKIYWNCQEKNIRNCREKNIRTVEKNIFRTVVKILGDEYCI